MKIAVCSDEVYPVHAFILDEIRRRGHEPICFGALRSHKNVSWVQAAEEASTAIFKDECQQGIFFCWSGTGICIAANKIPGIRAALCTDSQTVEAARVWNHANVLALSNRLLTTDLAKEILEKWFDTQDDVRGSEGVKELMELEKRFRHP